jgi:hypothetical protein
MDIKVHLGKDKERFDRIIEGLKGSKVKWYNGKNLEENSNHHTANWMYYSNGILNAGNTGFISDNEVTEEEFVRQIIQDLSIKNREIIDKLIDKIEPLDEIIKELKNSEEELGIDEATDLSEIQNNFTNHVRDISYVLSKFMNDAYKMSKNIELL